MKISSITPTQVWGASSRSLTNFGSSALAPSSTGQTSLAAASNVSIQPSNGILGFYGVAVVTGTSPTGAMAIRFSDTVNFNVVAITAISTAAPAAFASAVNNAVFLNIVNNDAAVAGKYMTTGWNLTI